MSSYDASLLADIGILTLGALSVYVILATGQLSLGNAAFVAIGAYTSSYLTATLGLAPTPAIALGAVLAAAIGVVVGFPALRLRGIFLAMATLGFGEIVRSFFLNFDALGGAQGFHGMPRVSALYVWIWTAAILVATAAFGTSRAFLGLRAVRDDEVAAGFMGLNTVRIKVTAFGFGAAIAAVSGGLFAHHHLYIEPGNFGFDRSIDLVLAVILGGSTLAIGSVLGAALLVLLPEILRPLADWRLAAFGILLVVVLLVRRDGLLDAKLLRRLVGRTVAK